MLSTTTENNITIATIEGTNKLTATNAEGFKAELNSLLQKKESNRLALDLSHIDFIDSSGFSCFISAMKTVNDNDGSLKICNINEEVLRIFKMLHLDQIFDVYASREDCLKAF